ncbi:hypothetical protein OG435_32845 [Streptomyces sp. NBC_01264]|nr:hypothetical protein [Streptomyces sp. NBC_01264]
MKKIAAADSRIIGMWFKNPDFTGDAMILIHPSRSACASISSEPITIDLNRVDATGSTGGLYDNKVNSEIGMNGCSIGGAQHPGYTGNMSSLQSIDYHTAGTSLYNEISSVRLAHAPTQKEAIIACSNGTAYCKETAES